MSRFVNLIFFSLLRGMEETIGKIRCAAIDNFSLLIAEEIAVTTMDGDKAFGVFVFFFHYSDVD